jgi:hypothetical protein
MKAIDIGDATWIDVDTPEAHAEAERLIALLGEDLGGPRERVSPSHSGRRARTC